jgi:hypothetical protein
MKKNTLLAIAISLFCASSASSQTTASVIDWKMTELPGITEIKGAPIEIETSLGKAISFDGVGDAFFLEKNPLNDLTELTLEVIIKPDGDGKFAQRFLHFGEVRGERIMFETRVNPDNTWYFDAHATMPDAKLTLIDEKLIHPTDRWYNVTLVVGGGCFTSYVNGVKQCSDSLNYTPINVGIASIGVRQNLVDWFKGSIYRIRITPRPLPSCEFLKDYEELNIEKQN